MTKPPGFGKINKYFQWFEIVKPDKAGSRKTSQALKLSPSNIGNKEKGFAAR